MPPNRGRTKRPFLEGSRHFDGFRIVEAREASGQPAPPLVQQGVVVGGLGLLGPRVGGSVARPAAALDEDEFVVVDDELAKP